MTNMEMNWQIEEFMVYCRSKQLRKKTMESYEQTLRLFERWCADMMNIHLVTEVTESVIRRYIADLQERGKYSYYADESRKECNCPDRRRDFRQPISATTINNYLRNLRVFFNWLEDEFLLKKNPMKKVR
ncbi:MAG: site-specific integrase, partial [Candidatus Aphodomorpha sp.]